MPREEVREMMGPSGHVQAHAQPTLGTGMAGTVSLAIRTHLWISWALQKEVRSENPGRGF
jgi:hypothetical protein